MRLSLTRFCWLLSVGLLVSLLLMQVPFLGLSSANEGGGDAAVRVTTVRSGDAIEVLEAGSMLGKAVRLLGIEAPDLRQLPWGEAAAQTLQTKLAGQTVRLEFDSIREDAYGRTLAYVWLGDRLVNEELVEEGWVLMKSDNSGNTRYDLRLANAQETARLLHRGIWNPTEPLRQLPRDFRRQLE